MKLSQEERCAYIDMLVLSVILNARMRSKLPWVSNLAGRVEVYGHTYSYKKRA